MIAFFTQQHRAVNICFVLVFVLGFLSLSELGREELPEFGGEGLSIQAFLPGASPDEMDLTVGRLLNKAIVGLPGVDEVSMIAKEGVVSVSITVKEDELDLDGLRREIAQLISQVPDLPADLEGPYVSRQFSRLFPPLTLLFKGGDDLQRHVAWKSIEQQLVNMPAVDALEVLGDREQRIEIRARPAILESSGLRVDSLASKIRVSLADGGSGVYRKSLENTRIRTQQQPTDVTTLKALALKTDAGIMPISYFADVVDTLAPEKIRVTHAEEKAWYVNLYRRKGSNIGQLSIDVRKYIQKLNAQYQEQGKPYSIKILYDRSHIVSKSLSDLTDSIFFGMALVFVILWMFLGSRNAFYAAIGIPFSFFAAFIAMDLLGLSINTLTLFGLVLVSGMVVDDAIVVLENIDQKKASGFEPLAAIVDGLREVAPAVVAATGTTIAVFLPLMLMSGGMGMYISLIPKVAILALVASLVECFVILPIHMYASGRDSTKANRETLLQLKLRVFMDRGSDFFSRCAVFLLARVYWSLGGFLGLLLFTTFIAYIRLDFKLFDESETRSIKFHLEFDESIDLRSNDQIVKHAVNQLKDFDGDIADTVVLAGFSNHNYNVIHKPHVSTIELPLTEKAIEEGLAVSLADELEPLFAALPGLNHIQRSLETNSPPTGVPVEIYLYGEDSAALLSTAARVKQTLNTIPSIRHVSDPMEDGVREQVLKLDSTWLGFHNLNAVEVGDLLRTAITGSKVGKIDRGHDVVDVLLMSDPHFSPFQTLAQANGRVIPQAELGELVEQSSADSIRRWQGLRYVSISADVDEEILSVFQTHREIERLIDDSILSPGITFEQQGEFSETQKSLVSMLQSGIIGLGLAYFILTLLFHSLIQPVIVLLAIPLSYMGVVWGMTLTNQPLTLMGFVGVVGLMGIVINDSLVWVSFYNRATSEGVLAREAAVQTVKQRFRPIWLTTITTVGGLLPVSLSQSAGIANAMASTMVYGLLAASVFLLLFLPVCVVVLDDVEYRVRNMRLPVLTQWLKWTKSLR